ncbi:ChaB family protein [Mesorhizobium sp. B2-4-11]|uniref:ChaB family protein n=1 Tax=Mesorhizobium sp. B2-4-11 TaxID=2589938 RepID=UPI0011283C2A|nr:ChaB family protein [Mesorhizobium sp. B2-4-11]TPL13033.1 hypothetical protein FJ944_08130 [Mesorhizobium sp. B2-4-11]
MFRAAFSSAWDEYADQSERREEIAHRVARAAVKRIFRKQGKDWSPFEPGQFDPNQNHPCHIHPMISNQALTQCGFNDAHRREASQCVQR